MVERHGAVPDTAGVQRNRVGVTRHAGERGPVPEQDAVVRSFPLRVAEPRGDLAVAEIGDARCRAAALALQVQCAIGRTVAHAGEIVGDHPQARHSGEIVRPLRRFIAVHGLQEGDTVRAAQYSFNFCRIPHCIFY